MWREKCLHFRSTSAVLTCTVNDKVSSDSSVTVMHAGNLLSMIFYFWLIFHVTLVLSSIAHAHTGF